MNCKLCGAPLVWCKTKDGKELACDAKKVYFVPGVAGREFVVTETGYITSAKLVEPDTPGAWTGHLFHWANCPG